MKALHEAARASVTATGAGNAQRAEGMGSGEPQLGQLLVREGLITSAQLDMALWLQERIGTYRPLGQILVEARLVTPKQLQFVLDRFRKRARLGHVLVKAGALSPEQLEAALELQHRTGRRLGELLVEENLISESAMRQALCTQLGIPFIDLDGLCVDRSQARVVNRRYAAIHRVVPVARMGSTLTVALDDPTDSQVVAELQASTGCRINVVTSTRAAFARAFARAYGDPGVDAPDPAAAGRGQEGAELGGTAAPAPPAVAPAIGPRPPPGVVDEITRDREQFVRSVETLKRECEDARRRSERLASQHQALEHALARLSREREEQGQALAEVRSAHEALQRAHAAAAAALHEFQRRHEALLRERDHTTDTLDAVLRRLKT